MKFGLGFFPTAEAIPPGELGRLVEERGHESLFFAEHTHIPAARQSEYPAGGELPPKYARTRRPSGCPHARLAAPHTLRGASSSVGQIAPLFGLPASYPRSVRHSPAARAGIRMGARPLRRLHRRRCGWTSQDHLLAGDCRSTRRRRPPAPVNLERIWSWPKPAQRPHPPILVGGNGPTVIDRVLRFGDAWFPNYGDREGFERKLADLRARAERPIEVQVISVPADPAKLEQLAELGVSRVAHWLPSGKLSVVEPALERWELAIAQLYGEA